MRRRIFGAALLALAFLSPTVFYSYAEDGGILESTDEGKPIVLSAKEAQAIGDLQSLHDVCIAYRDTNSGFPEGLGILAEGNSPAISQELANGENPGIGYHYYYSYIDRDRYEIFAESSLPQRTFYIDQAGVVKLGDQSGLPVYENR